MFFKPYEYINIYIYIYVGTNHGLICDHVSMVIRMMPSAKFFASGF